MKAGNSKILVIVITAVVVICGVIAALVVPNAMRTNDYNQGVTCAEHGLYDEAIAKFAALGGFQDSDNYLDYCLMRKAAGKEDWKTAAQYAAKIPTFKDAASYAQLSDACLKYADGDLEAAIAGIRGLEALPEAAGFEKKWSQEYADARVLEVSGLMGRQNWDQAVLYIDHALDYCQDARLDQARAECVDQIRERDYREGVRLIKAGQFADALTLLRTVADYKDSQAMIAHLEAGEQGERYLTAAMTANTDPHELAAMYREIGDYQDAAEKAAAYQEEANRMDYNRAVALLDKGQWQAAKEAFTALGGYEDSAVLVLTAENGRKQERYDEARSLMEGGWYDAAAAMFEGLGDYKDSKVFLLTCSQAIREERYQAAISAYESGDYETAEALFQELGDYKESAVYCAWITHMNGIH